MAKKKTGLVDDTQIQLFSGSQAPEPFKKAVEAIHIAPKSGAIGLQKLRVWDVLIKNAIEQDAITPGIDEFTIQLQDLMKQVGMANSNNRDYLKATVKSLVTTAVDWDVLDEKNRHLWNASGLLSGVTIVESVMHYQFSKQLRTVLINPKVYATLDMALMRQFTRGHARTLWQQVTRFRKIGHTGKIPVDTLRSMFVGQDAVNSSYAEYKILKRAVLSPALKEINAITELDVDMEEFRDGRAVSAVQFFMKPKPNAIVHANVDLELLAEVAKLGLPNSEARNVIVAHGDESVRKALAYTKARIAKKSLAPVTSVPAYFRNALKSGYQVIDAIPSGTHIEVAAAAAEELQSKVQAPTPAEIRARIIMSKLPEAKLYFVELDTADQTNLVSEYNAQQSIKKWQVSTTKTPTDGAERAFYDWLVKKTWGEPTEEDIIAFLYAGEQK